MGTERLAYTVAEAAKALGISRSKAYTEVKVGRLPVVRLGGRLLIPADRLRQQLNEAAVGDLPSAAS